MQYPTRLFEAPYFQLQNFPKTDALNTKVNGKWVSLSTAEIIEKINLVSRALLQLGIKPGDKIALISTNNRSEFVVMDFGILQIGAIDVPMYPTAPESDYIFILNDAEVKLCFVSDEVLYQKVQKIRPQCPTLRDVYTFDKGQGAKNWEELFAMAQSVNISEVDRLKNEVKEGNLATLIYTSGTTGTPKGVMLSHKNIMSNSIASISRLPIENGCKALSFLPLCHVYERMVIYFYFITGISVYFAENMDTIGDDLKEVKPDVFTAVPRLLEKVYDKIITKASELKGFKKTLFDWAVGLALKYEPYGVNGFWYEFKLSIARALIFKKIKQGAGLVNVRAIASGAAALQPRLARFFNGGNIPVVEGYGLTETSPVVAVNEEANRGMMFGTVGRAISGVKVKIDKDPEREDKEEGEILVRGDLIMLGYYKRPDATAEVIDKDGWFHTGDIGKIVGDGFLKITDRKKEIFKTAGGKYVAPQQMENKFKESPFVDQVIVIGEYRKHPAALVVPAFDKLKQWSSEAGIKYTTDQDAVKNEQVKNKIWEEINKFNALFGHWEQVKKIELLPKPFSIEAGEMTPTMKLKRKVIHERYKNLIEKIYEN
ncbi:MAG: long-chain fatty acid--CoA ligase [Bacteroidetes bacterium]|nr:long-chain fatty acid--CoA ligase [Bacteroidota bacterium]